LSYLRK